MDISIIIIIWIVITVLQGVFENKKTKPPRKIETNQPTPEINLAEIYQQKKLESKLNGKIESGNVLSKSDEKPPKQKKFKLDLTPNATMNAIILGEILNKPKFRR